MRYTSTRPLRGGNRAELRPVETADYERRFRRAGLPLFVEGFSASTDVFNRAAPLLGLVFLGELLGAGKLDWSWWQNLLAIAGALALMLAAVAIINVLRGRPARAVPNRLGKTELAAFVILPALLPLIFGGQLGSAVATVAANLFLLILIYAVFVYGLLAILVWVFSRLAGQLRSSLGLLAKAVPLLAIFALLSFTTEEMWEMFGKMAGFDYLVVIGLFVVLGSAFLLVRVPREARTLEVEVGEGPPLSRAQRVNVGLVLFVSQATQVLIVSITVGLFFVVFGLLAVDTDLRIEWMDIPGDTLLSFPLGGQDFQLTAELLRVAGGLAAFSGFYFAVAMLTDSTYREEFLTELTDEMRTSFRDRREYLRLRGVGRRMILDGYRHRPGNHCGSTALRNLLAFHGVEISEEMALGLGAGVCFYYVHLDGQSPSRFTNGRVGRLEEQFLELTRAGAAARHLRRARGIVGRGPPSGRRRAPGAAAHRPLLPRPLRQLGPLPRPRGRARRLRRRGRLPLRHRFRGAADDPAREPRPGAPRHPPGLPARRSDGHGGRPGCARPTRAPPRRRRSRATPRRCSSRRWASSRACRRCAASPPRSADGRESSRTGSGGRASATR